MNFQKTNCNESLSIWLADLVIIIGVQMQLNDVEEAPLKNKSAHFLSSFFSKSIIGRAVTSPHICDVKMNKPIV